MMNIARVVTILVAGCLVYSGTNAAAGLGQSSEHEKALASLVEAERAFSRTSEAKGIREAFLTWLAPDAVVFRPAPVEGRPVYEKMDRANPAVLTWEPEVAEVAASGELGYTSGPYVFRPARGAEPSAFGHYVSIWKKQTDGGWKVFLDIGVQHDRPGAPPSAGKVDTPAADKSAKILSPEQRRDELSAFGPKAASLDAKAAGDGLRKALSKVAAEDIRVYRPGKMPTVGRSRIKELVPADAGLVAGGTHDNRAQNQTDMAWSGDLAYSYGTFFYFRRDTKKAETISFLRIWRKDPSGQWKICLDIELPLPAERDKKG